MFKHHIMPKFFTYYQLTLQNNLHVPLFQENQWQLHFLHFYIWTSQRTQKKTHHISRKFVEMNINTDEIYIISSYLLMNNHSEGTHPLKFHCKHLWISSDDKLWSVLFNSFFVKLMFVIGSSAFKIFFEPIYYLDLFRKCHRFKKFHFSKQSLKY